MHEFLGLINHVDRFVHTINDLEAHGASTLSDPNHGDKRVSSGTTLHSDNLRENNNKNDSKCSMTVRGTTPIDPTMGSPDTKLVRKVNVSFLDDKSTMTSDMQRSPLSSISNSSPVTSQRRSLSPRKGTPLYKRMREQRYRNVVDDEMSWNDNNSLQQPECNRKLAIDSFISKEFLVFDENDHSHQKERSVRSFTSSDGMQAVASGEDYNAESDDDEKENDAYLSTIEEWDRLVTENSQNDSTLRNSYWQYCYGTFIQQKDYSKTSKPPLPIKSKNHHYPQSIMKKKNTKPTLLTRESMLVTPQRMNDAKASSERRSVGKLHFAPSSAAEFDENQPVHGSLTPLPPEIAAERFTIDIQQISQKEIEESEESKRNAAILAQFDDDDDDDENKMEIDRLDRKKRRPKQSRRRNIKKKGKKDNRRESCYFSSAVKEADSWDDLPATNEIIDQNCDETHCIQFSLDARLLMNDEDNDLTCSSLSTQKKGGSGLEDIDKISILTLASPRVAFPPSAQVIHIGNNLNQDSRSKPLCDELVVNTPRNQSIDDLTRDVCSRSEFDDWLIFERLPLDKISSENDDEFVDILKFFLSESHLVPILKFGMMKLDGLRSTGSTFATESMNISVEESSLQYEGWQCFAEYEWIKIVNAVLDEFLAVMDSEIFDTLDHSLQELDNALKQINALDSNSKSSYLVKKLFRKERVLLSRNESEFELEEKRNAELWKNLNQEIQKEVDASSYLYKATLRLVPMELSEDLADMETIGLLYRPVIPGVLVQLLCDIDGHILNVDLILDRKENGGGVLPNESQAIVECFQHLLSFGGRAFNHLLEYDDGNVLIYNFPALLNYSSFLDRLNNTIWDMKQIVNMGTMGIFLDNDGITFCIRGSQGVSIQALFRENLISQCYLCELPSSLQALDNENQVVGRDKECLFNGTYGRFQTFYNMTLQSLTQSGKITPNLQTVCSKDW